MSVLVLGANGFIGRVVCRRLTASGNDVIAASRNHPSVPVPDDAFSYVALDRADPEAVKRLIRDRAVSTLIDMIAYTLPETEALLGAIAPEIDQYVLISSSDVYRNYGILHRLETGAAEASLAETSPVRSSRFPYRLEAPRDTASPDKWMDSYDKIPIEDAARSSDVATTILRLPMVYGPDDKQHRFKWMIDAVLSAEDTVQIPADWLNWVTTYGFVDNVGAAIAYCVGRTATSGETINVVDTPPVAHSVWLERVSIVLGRQIVVEPDHRPDSEGAQLLAHLDLSAPLALTGSKLLEELGFEPPVSLSDSIKATIDYERRL